MIINKDLVSVIVPVYNCETYLPFCVDSIVKQTYENLEILLINDGSTDNTLKICNEYASQDERIVVISQENKGVSSARNTGIENAAGSFVVFVDSDDELELRAIEVLMYGIVYNDADICSATKKHVYLDGHINRTLDDEKMNVYEGDEMIKRSLLYDNKTRSLHAKIFTRKFLHDIRFVESHNMNEDGYFLFECYAKRPKVVQYNVCVYKYFQRESSASRGSFSDKYFSMLYFCERKKEIIAEKFPEYIEQAYNMEVRTHLLFLQVLCRTNEKKYKNAYKESAKTVRKLYKYHVPINKHHKLLAWLAAHGLYPLYKFAVRLKYYRW